MDNREDIAARFPASRDDEPSSLRDDIVDELADHLQCAAVREKTSRLRQADEAADDAISSTVLRRFGDPSVVARNLWFEGMKEKLMTQRMTIGTLIFVFLVTTGMFVLTWRNMDSFAARTAQPQQVDAELLKEIRSLVESARDGDAHNNRPAEWSHLQVKCIFDATDGPPAEGVRVRLASDSDSTSRLPPYDEQTDEQGLVDFGHVLFGSYKLDVTAPCGATLSRQLSVHPGREKLETIVCPSQGTAPVQLNIVNKWQGEVPKNLREKLWWRLTLFSNPENVRTGWTNDTGAGATIYVTPRGQYSVVLWKNGQSSIEHAILQPQTDPFWEANGIGAFAYADRLESTDTVVLPFGQYYLSYTSICMQSSTDETGRTLVEMFSKASAVDVVTPAIDMQYVYVSLDKADPVTIELKTDLDRVRRINLAANMPVGKEMVSMYAQVPDGIGCESRVDLSVRFPSNDGGLAPPLRLLSSVTVASVTPSRSSKPTFPTTVLMLSEEEADILNLARFTGRLFITPHRSDEPDEPRIADSPFKALNERASGLEVPDDMQLVAVPVCDEVADDETSEQNSAATPSSGDYVTLTARVPLGQTCNTAVMMPRQPSSWAQSEFEAILVQGVATTPKTFQPHYQVYLLQARKQDQAHRLQTRMHEIQVERVAARQEF